MIIASGSKLVAGHLVHLNVKRNIWGGELKDDDSEGGLGQQAK